MRILVVAPSDVGGGAEATAAALWRGYRAAGHDAWWVVGKRRGPAQPGLAELDDAGARNAWTRTLLRQAQGVGVPLVSHALDRAGRLGEPLRLLRKQLGGEDVDFPASRALLAWASDVDAIHVHNLHGDYFDLRVLPALSRTARTVVTLHDMWLLTGHCAHAMDCPRFAVGCGDCPDLARYPSVHRDATAVNRQRKTALLRDSALTFAAPSRWLLDHAANALPAAHVHLVAHGVETQHFHPRHRQAARAQLGLPKGAFVVAWDGSGNRTYRDAQTARAALQALRVPGLVVLQLGEGAPLGDVSGAVVAPGRLDSAGMGTALRAADVYLHLSRADTYPSGVLEAQACGAVVVATKVGGIPQQVRHQHTGLLVPVGDVNAAVDGIKRLEGDPALRRRLAQAASATSVPFEDTVAAYLALLKQS